MRVSVMLTDLRGNETRSRTIEFDSYEELNRRVNEFENETGFEKIDCDIEDLDGDCDRNELDNIELGDF